ncbi:hypothetical protein N7G274_003955 [Stereocaulon virgatum]|uniref:Uncharacterized protein n=1 Tax=Stereocaulon virgatum TaxID=373712 RepID=A0ABR4AD13_9LECA
MASICVLRSHPAAHSTIYQPHYQHSQTLDHQHFLPHLQRSRAMNDLGRAREDSIYGAATAMVMSDYTRRQSRSYLGAHEGNSSSTEDSNGGPSRQAESREVQMYEDAVPKSEFAPHLDAEVEALISRISENVVIMDRAIQDPLFLEVPKGYLMEEAVSATSFYQTRAEVRTHAKKRKRELGILPKSLWYDRQQERQGFQAQEVNSVGAVHLEDCRPVNLRNAIHPLFDRSCFDDTPDAIYDQLIPALQLATMFLTQPICMQFWVTLALGYRRYDAEMSAYNGRPCQRIESHLELTEERAYAMIKRILALGRSKLIHFRFKNRLSSSKGGAWGTSAPVCDYRGIQQEFHGRQGLLIRSLVKLHADYYIVAKKLSQLKYPEVSQKLRFSFNFAVLLVHEVAHSIEGIHIRGRADQWIDWQTSHFYREIYWLDWEDVEHGAELGRAWEETMFGGEIGLINNRADGSHGIGTSDWPPRGSLDDPNRRIWHTVSMEYIERMFQMETWQRNFDLKCWRVFNIERDGAASLYINSFTTMSWDEEQRVANEEIAELLALENEQPAKKKRLTGEGEAEEHRLEDEAVIEMAIDEQALHSKSPDYEHDRQVPVFRNTRRLSSVMPGALPDSKATVTISPRPRMRVSKEFAEARKRMNEARKDPNTPEARQRAFMEQQRSMDKQRHVAAYMTKQDNALKRSKAEKSTFKLLKQIKSKPTGLMDKRRRRKKTEQMHKRAEEKRRVEMSEQRRAQVKEELIANWRKSTLERKGGGEVVE